MLGVSVSAQRENLIRITIQEKSEWKKRQRE
jgi:hypothetical protein